MKNILVLILGLFLIGCHASEEYLKSEFIVSKIEHHYGYDGSGAGYNYYLIRLEQIYDSDAENRSFTPIYLNFRTPIKPEYKIGDILVLTVK